MNGAFLLIPFLLIRFGLLAALDRQGGALARAARFAPMAGGERAAYWGYQLLNTAIFAAMFWLRVEFVPDLLFGGGAVLCTAGLALCAASMAAFAAPGGEGFCQRGVYRFSRNPMYVGYFLCFLGWALLTRSPLLGGMVLAFQSCAHWVILAEERWCRRQFGGAYRRYMAQVGRYLGRRAPR